MAHLCARSGRSFSSLLPVLTRGSVRLFATEPAILSTEGPSVADRIVQVTCIDADGHRQVIKGLSGRTLLSAMIRSEIEDAERHPLEELGACNGTCEVTIAQEWLEKLPERTQAEEDRLRLVSTTGTVNKSSRLGCQVVLDKSLDGMTVAMVEERPWYTL